jgi:hypothetical protein
LKLVVLDVLLGESHQFVDQQVAPVRENEGALLAERGVEGVVEKVGVPPDELVLQLAGRKAFELRRSGECAQHIGLHADDVAVDVRRADLESGDIAVVVDVGLARGQGDVEVGQDELPFQVGVAIGIEQCDLEQIVAVEHLAGDAQLLGHQADGRDAAALAVAAVLHLDGGLVNESPADGDGAGEARDAAAAFFGGFGVDRLPRSAVDLRTGG